MKVANLETGFYLYGNKGTVWSDNAHIAQSGIFSGKTLCGTPMLATNWARIEKLEEAKCPECNKVYLEKTKTTTSK